MGYVIGALAAVAAILVYLVLGRSRSTPVRKRRKVYYRRPPEEGD